MITSGVFFNKIEELSTICKTGFAITSVEKRTFGNMHLYEELPEIIANIKKVFPKEDVLIHQGQQISEKYLFTFILVDKNNITQI